MFKDSGLYPNETGWLHKMLFFFLTDKVAVLKIDDKRHVFVARDGHKGYI